MSSLTADVEELLAASDSDEDDFLSLDTDAISIEAILREDDDDDDDEAMALAFKSSYGALTSNASHEGGSEFPETLKEYSEADTLSNTEQDRDAKLLQKILKETDDEPIHDLDQELRLKRDIVDSILNEYESEHTEAAMGALSRFSDIGGSNLDRAEMREQRLLSLGNKEITSPLQVKRKLRSQHRSRTQARTRTSTGGSSTTPVDSNRLHIGVGAGVVRVKPMEIISRQLQKNSQYRQHGPGLPTAISIHPKFIAIGTSRSLVLVFDHFQEVRQVLGNTSESKDDGPVTAIDVSPGSDFLVCGYSSGRVVLWDIMKGSCLKGVSDAHSAQIATVRFWKDKKPYVVSVDTRGLVNKISFQHYVLAWTASVECLLDGAAGQIPAVSVLPPPPGGTSEREKGATMGESKGGDAMVGEGGHPAENFSLVSLSSPKISFIICVEPEVKVLFKWPKPADVGPDDAVLPSLAFDWAQINANTNVRSIAGCTPVIARGWGKHLQLLQASFPGGGPSENGWPKFSECCHLQTSSPVLALQWLKPDILVYLNASDELCVFDSKNEQELEVVDVSAIKLVYATYSHLNTCSFANSFRTCGGALYLLGLKELQVARVQTWAQRIETLKEDGEWLEALALALDHYENMQKRSCDGEVPAAIKAQASKLLMSYVNLAITNSPESSTTAAGDAAADAEGAEAAAASRSSKLTLSSKLDLARSHYQMLGGVCIEYCVVIRRPDLLFGEIFRQFRTANRVGLFVELLEPYILNDALRQLQPEVMQALVHHFSTPPMNMVERVELCLLHMDVHYLDFDSVIRLCQSRQLYSALIYVYNRGLMDYKTPVDVLLRGMHEDDEAATDTGANKEADAAAAGGVLTHVQGSAWTRMEQLGYRLLLYVSYCFTGKNFPRGTPTENTDMLPTMRKELFEILIERTPTKSHAMVPGESRRRGPNGEPPEPPPLPSWLEGNYPRLVCLLRLDIAETLHILGELFDLKRELQHLGGGGHDIERQRELSREVATGRLSECAEFQTERLNMDADFQDTIEMRQAVVDALVAVILDKAGGDGDGEDDEDGDGGPTGEFAVGALYMFLAKCLVSGAINPTAQRRQPTSIIDDALAHLSLGTNSAQQPGSGASSSKGGRGSSRGAQRLLSTDRKLREQILVRLVEILPEDPEIFAADTLLPLAMQQNLHRLEVALYKRKDAVGDVLGAYLADPDQSFQREIFTYLRTEGQGAKQRAMAEVEGGEEESGESGRARLVRLREALMPLVIQLIKLDVASTAVLVLDLCPEENDRVVAQLAQRDPQMQYNYLKVIIGSANAMEREREGEGDGDVEGDGDGEGESEGAIGDLMKQSNFRVTAEMNERYIELLCQFDKDEVLPYLQSREDVHLEKVTQLCKHYGITNATAFLLEKAGDESGALKLILETVESKLKELENSAVLHQISLTAHTHSSHSKDYAPLQPVADNGQPKHKRAPTSTITIRASLSESDEGCHVIKTLDMAVGLCERNSARNKGDAQSEKLWFGLLDKFVHAQKQTKHDLSMGPKGAAMQVALNELIRIILDSMAGHVSLRAILSKITSDHGDEKLGEFRQTILGMLDTYRYEQNIYQTANQLVSEDLYSEGEKLRMIRAKRLDEAQIKVQGDGGTSTSRPASRVGAENAAPEAAGGAKKGTGGPNTAADEVAAARNKKTEQATTATLKKMMRARKMKKLHNKHKRTGLQMLEDLETTEEAKNREGGGGAGSGFDTALGMLELVPQGFVEHERVTEDRRPGAMDSRPQFTGQYEPDMTDREAGFRFDYKAKIGGGGGAGGGEMVGGI
jgi:hypothetical protein